MSIAYRIRFRQADIEFEIEGDRTYVTKTYQDLKEMLGLSERPKPVLAGEQKTTKSSTGKSLGGKTSSPREFIDRYGVKRHVDIVLAFGYFLERIRGQKNFTGADINTCYYEAKVEPASRDLFGIIEYIRKDNAPAAQRVATAIYQSVDSLSSFPNLGRLGRQEGTRELPVSALPFLVVYRVTQDAVEIAGVIHGAQRWPPEE